MGMPAAGSGLTDAGDRRRALAILAGAFACWVTAFLVVRSVVQAHGGYSLPWDSAWYSQIATQGYSFDGDLMRQHPVAFLPLYPLLVRAVLTLGVPIKAAVLAVSLVSTAAGILFLFRALSSRFEATWSALACALVMAGPFSIYFLNGYSECLYFLFFGAFWWALLRREDFVVAALCAGLAGAVRPFGLLLAAVWAASLLLGVYRGNLTRSRALTLFVALGPAAIGGMMAVSLFYYLEFADLFLYRNAMLAWSRDLVDGIALSPVDQFLQNVRALFSAHAASLLTFPPAFARLLLWAFVLLLPFAVRRLPIEISIYGIGLLLFCIALSATGLDMGRHLATNLMLPLAVLMLVWPRRETAEGRHLPKAWQAMLVALLFFGGLLTQAWFCVRYFNGQWVS